MTEDIIKALERINNYSIYGAFPGAISKGLITKEIFKIAEEKHDPRYQELLKAKSLDEKGNIYNLLAEKYGRQAISNLKGENIIPVKVDGKEIGHYEIDMSHFEKGDN